MTHEGPNWIAPREGQDWRDDEVLAAVDWLKGFVPRAEMERRLDAARARLTRAGELWRNGEGADAHDPADAAAWWILQGESFGDGREWTAPDMLARTVPYLTRLGRELDRIRAIPGAEERAERMMNGGRAAVEPAIYELLVALAWSRHGWTTTFVPEVRGGPRSPDLIVARPRRHWAVECKRVTRTAYAENERAHGLALASPVHRLSERLGRSVVVRVAYKAELQDIPADYLEARVAEALEGPLQWDDAVSAGRLTPPNWRLVREVMDRDDVYYGSSRMIELASGRYDDQADHSFSGRWRPAEGRPFYASTLYHCSVVTWISTARQAQLLKAQHFRRLIADAEGQLPDDRPGVVHVGFETMNGRASERLRHLRNVVEARLYTPRNPRFRWVYGNYFAPERTTARMETWALNESMAPYRIGRHRTAWPLPDHMLVSDEDDLHPGMHF